MLYLGADHGGYKLKEQLKGYLEDEGIDYEDLGNNKLDDKDDYPIYAKAVAEKVAQDPANSLGVLLCRTGVGVNIVADKFDNVLCVLGFNDEQVKKARADEGANVLAIASDYTSFDELKPRVKLFLETPFSGQERHKRRLEEIEAIEDENFKNATKGCNCTNCVCN